MYLPTSIELTTFPDGIDILLCIYQPQLNLPHSLMVQIYYYMYLPTSIELTTFSDGRPPVDQDALPGALLTVGGEYWTHTLGQLCLTRAQVIHAVTVVSLGVNIQVAVWEKKFQKEKLLYYNFEYLSRKLLYQSWKQVSYP